MFASVFINTRACDRIYRNHYQTRPQITLLRLSVVSQTDMTVGIDNSASSKVKPAVLKLVVFCSVTLFVGVQVQPSI